jgi:hypothetical protein
MLKKPTQTQKGLRPFVEAWISIALQETGGQQPDADEVKQEILKRLRPLGNYIKDNEFASVLEKLHKTLKHNAEPQSATSLSKLFT